MGEESGAGRGSREEEKEKLASPSSGVEDKAL
jgi:hypothetical protein